MEMPANPRFMDLTGHNYGRWATSHEQNRNKRTPKNNTSGAKLMTSMKMEWLKRSPTLQINRQG